MGAHASAENITQASRDVPSTATYLTVCTRKCGSKGAAPCLTRPIITFLCELFIKKTTLNLLNEKIRFFN